MTFNNNAVIRGALYISDSQISTFAPTVLHYRTAEQMKGEKRDIRKPRDIQRVVNTFFRGVKKDPLLSPFFTDKTKEEWATFLPMMYSFWENVLFYSGGYFGNPMARHKEMHELRNFTPAHFEQWLHLFSESIDQLYSGPHAEMMKERARNIATVMQVKLAQ